MAKKPNAPKDKDYADLGKAVQKVLLTDYFNVIENKKRFFWMSFIRGLLAGLGGVIGATIVVAIIVWLLSVFGELPVIGDFFNQTKDTLQQ